MKKRILSLLLAVVLVTALCAVPAMAIDSKTFTVYKDSAVDCSYSMKKTITDYSLETGSLPDGVSAYTSGKKIVFTGTPTKVDYYVCTYKITLEGGDTKALEIAFDVKAPGALVITKSPTKESCEEGGKCSYVANANNAASWTWVFVSPDGSKTYSEAEAKSAFKGLKIVYWTKNTKNDGISIQNIPIELNEWSVKCVFTGTDGSTAETQPALITVTEKDLLAPTISANPSGGTFEPGESVTLSVSAKSEDDTTLAYQWYEASSSSGSGKAISGATSSTYTVSKNDGSYYYYCAVTAVKGERTSPITKSAKAEVTWAEVVVTPEPTPTPTPEATPTPTPQLPEEPEEPDTPDVTPEDPGDPAEDLDIGGDPENTPAPSDGPTVVDPSDKDDDKDDGKGSGEKVKGNTSLTVTLIIIIGIILLLLVVAIILIVLLYNRNNYYRNRRR